MDYGYTNWALRFGDILLKYCFAGRYRERVESSMLKIKARAGESVQQMIRRFKKLCEKEGLIRDMKRNAHYEKPSEKNRRRMRKSQRVVGDFIGPSNNSY